MIRLGLTGGIGSGKSLVAAIFRSLGVPVFEADRAAHQALQQKSTRDQLLQHFGDSVIDASGSVNRKILASIVFTDESKLSILNALIHPRVKSAFDEWCHQHAGEAYVVHEAAILFESGFNKYFDKVVTVYAPRELCIQRVAERDNSDPEAVRQRMSHQWDPELIAGLSDYVLRNDGSMLLLPQVIALHRAISGTSDITSQS